MEVIGQGALKDVLFFKELTIFHLFWHYILTIVSFLNLALFLPWNADGDILKNVGNME